MTWFVEAAPERPNFMLVISFLWGDLHDVDSDGDSSPASSRTWTWLQVCNRAAPAEAVSVAMEDDGRSLRVDSDVPWLAAATAYFLAHEGATRVRADATEPWTPCDVLVAHLGDFDLGAALARSDASIWRQATIDNPYPNRR